MELWPKCTPIQIGHFSSQYEQWLPGTDIGGTVQYKQEEPLDMWMGMWSPRVHRHPPNWK
jgi:hypothetical protein